MSESTGILCVSVDQQQQPEPHSTDGLQRRDDLVDLFQRFEISANWTIGSSQSSDIRGQREYTLELPKSSTRSEIAQFLRMNTKMQNSGERLISVVSDPHEARKNWDLLVRQGCTITRPRAAESARQAEPSILRGGLWIVPMNCSFVGGSKRSVRTLFGTCQRRLVESVLRRELYHLHIDIGNRRTSWAEELEAIRALIETASEQRKRGRLRSAYLSELPDILTGKPSRPMISILKQAA